ncbi:DNA oxidative demethylase ALKBH2 isoform X1 [Ictalurus furcatus]|uniref:DNA oxidative demethylase ALKBH2 isoform X1 n=2 Tax=Ictalurus furcatus TaxID=66913 RepID=UPI002350B391|nr:DNA oxidative demethylase ALKBH2 isoform X1 [Ictalurus furcatus]
MFMFIIIIIIINEDTHIKNIKTHSVVCLKTPQYYCSQHIFFISAGDGMSRQESACVESNKQMEKPCREERSEAVDEEDEFPHPIPWQKIEAQELDCDYGLLFSKEEANRLFMQLEEEVEYFTDEDVKVQVYGKMYSVPRKQATYGDEGLVYSFSGVHLAARVWTPTLEYIRDAVTNATGHTFNFVLINRYKDGLDHIGEHRDDEHELDPSCPIAAVSLGAARDFVFRHKDARKEPKQRHIEPVKLELAHGSLLLMNSPTNTYWYHSLPVRKKVKTPRISLTFRRIVKSRQKRKKE